MKINKNVNGITLIALVVTIVVLLILAGVSISMLTGENGVITQAKEAKEETEYERLKELVNLAVTKLMGDNLGNTQRITPKMVADEVNKMENRTDVRADGIIFPTEIIFEKENKSVPVNINSDNINFDSIIEDVIANEEKYKEEAEKIGQTETEDIGIGTDGKVVNLDLWRYFITDEGKGVSLGKRIGSSRVFGYYKENIIDGKIIGEFPQYIYIKSNNFVYPVTELNSTFYYYEPEIEIVELPKLPNTVIATDGAFLECNELKSITIPNSVINIGFETFSGCSSLINITIPNSVTNIGSSAFYRCSSLTNITIPSSVTTIGDYALSDCSSLTNITIPSSVIDMGRSVFDDWKENQTINIQFKENKLPSGWVNNWEGYNCNATINYL